ncbi:MAG TPA: DUF4173 domain-containing protein [Lachnospiraceae bacterium]|nr:DUF4173 domain-containing protein [Lachnospiraceae bacterium]
MEIEDKNKVEMNKEEMNKEEMNKEVMNKDDINNREKHNYTESLKKQYGVLGLGSFLYACFYALCMYKNASGITYPFFLLGSLWFYYFCMKKLGISLKRESIFYMTSILLLGISTFLTADTRIIFMNKTGVFVLILSFLLHHFFEDANWTFGRYFCYLFATPFASLGEIARPVQDMAAFCKENKKAGKGKILYVIIGLCVSIPLFLIIWILLMSADLVFGDLSIELFKKLDIRNMIGILFTIVFVYYITYCIFSFLCKKPFSEEYRKVPQAEALLAITITLPLSALYVLFSVIQIVCLFMQKIDLTKYSYAEYARQGFFQLLAVCIINLLLVLVGHAYFKESSLLKGILTVISLCTYIMVVSAAFRMILYIQNYYLTFLRLFVLWSLGVLFILLTGVIISIYSRTFPLFRFGMAVVTICYIILSFSHPDYWIAKCNVEHMYPYTEDHFFDTEYYEDYEYLSNLSMDAAPVLEPVLKEKGFDLDTAVIGVEKGDGYQSLTNYYGGLPCEETSWGYYYLRKMYMDTEGLGIRSFNLSRYIAQKSYKNIKNLKD